jgi:mono/diheme cytochrome c family protein
MKIIIPTSLVCGAFLALLTLPFLAADETPKIKKVPAHATSAISGQELFHEYCAVCHGNDAKGTGPAAAALKTKPADLTLINRKNGGRYPEIRVQRVIQGEDEVMAHGSRDMPVWGQIFRHMSANQDLGAVRIFNLVKYIEQIQAK